MPVPFSELSSERVSENSDAVRARVIVAREIQTRRFEKQEGVYCNAQMGSKLLKEICVISSVVEP